MEVIRKEELSIVERAKEYLDLHNLSSRVQSLFETDVVRKIIHEKYEAYEAEIKDVVDEFLKCDFPKPFADRAKEVYKQVINQEKIYADDVKISLICSLHSTLQNIEKFLVVDENIENIFRNGLVEENVTMIDALSQICEGVNLKMIEKIIEVMTMPFEVSEELPNFLLETSGEMSMMNMEEMQSMFEENTVNNQRGFSKKGTIFS